MSMVVRRQPRSPLCTGSAARFASVSVNVSGQLYSRDSSRSMRSVLSRPSSLVETSNEQRSKNHYGLGSISEASRKH